jgi:predicted kinase
MYSVEKEVISGPGWQASAVCGQCGHAHPFLHLPLWVVTGASGTGKTTIALAASRLDRTFVHLESDILWRGEFNHPDNNYRGYREVWLRLVKNIHQAGRPVILYGSVAPQDLEHCLERRYIARIHYLALVCPGQVLEERLRSRPGWRQAGSDAFLHDMQVFNQWFLSSRHPDVETLDTSLDHPEDTAQAVVRWAARDWTRMERIEKDD